MSYRIGCLLLFPLLLIQGRRVRSTIPLLPEPDGARSGADGEGAPLRLLIVGDSAAAGVGAASQDEALAGQLVSHLVPDFRVDWDLHARTGATTASTLETLEELEPQPVDVVVTSVGLNDITAGIRLPDWRRLQERLRMTLRDRFDGPELVVSGLPPAHLFPALPQPLRWCLGSRATEFHRDLRRQLARCPDAHFLDVRAAVDEPAGGAAELMAPDGFHPGPPIYAAWGRRAAALIREVV